MPRVAFTTENKVEKVNYDFPKLKLKKGEQARVLIGLEDPIVEYVHTLRKPKIVDGEPVYETVERGRSKEKVTVNAMDFVGQPLCLGDLTVLGEDGVDPKHCPACAAAKKNPDMFQPPKRRYAMHIIRYKTKSGSFDLVQPYSVETLVWSFTDNVFNKLVDFKSEWGDLKKHDLMLGPCTVETFQQFDINVGAKAAWLEGGKERAELTKETFTSNMIDDLTIATGSKKKLEWVEQDVDTILEAWSEVLRLEGKAPKAAESSSSLSSDLSSLMDSDNGKDAEGWSKEAPAESPAAADTVAEEPDTDDLLASLGSDDGAGEEKAEAPAESASESSDDDMNFDDLLDSLK